MNFNYKWNFREQSAKIDKLVLEHITKKWEKWDWRIKNTRDKKKYKIVDYQYRTRKIMYGLVTYKRRIYEYFDEKLQKWVRVCLVDEWLELPKYKRIGEDVEQTIIEYFADGKRYHDICAICKKAGISVSTVHRVFKNLKVIEVNPVKVKLEKNQPIFVAIDDGHRKFWNFKRKGIKHSMRLIVTYTDNINHKVQNKRVKAIIRPTKTAIGVKKTAEFVKEHCQNFYENIEQAKIIICGDSAGWIKDVADYLGAQFVLDKFHLIRTLYLGIMSGNKGKYLKKYNHCKNLINNGQYEQLIIYLYKELDNHKKLKKQYFKNNKQGIENQGAKWNIGCFTETNIWHVLKEMLGNRTYTDNINHKVQNKRVKAIIRPTKTAIGVKKTAEFVKEHCQNFYENIEQAKIIICGDSAGWIKDVADYLGAQFVLDKFHLIRTLYLGIMSGNKGKYLKKYNHCKNLINNGQYEQLIIYLYKELDNHKKLKKQYFKNNKQGIENQGAKWNIGCFTETNIWHVLKEMLGNRTYNILIYIKMVIFKCNKINLET